MMRSCAGLPPSRAPFVGDGISLQALVGQTTSGSKGVAPLLNDCEFKRFAPLLNDNYCGFKGVTTPCLILLSLGEVDVLVVQVVIPADGGQRIEARSAVLERQAHLVQLQ